MSSMHGAAFAYGLLKPEKVQAVLRSASAEAPQSDRFAASTLLNRRSFTAPILRNPDTEWLYGEVWSMFTAFNRTSQLDFDAIEVPLQVIRYPVGGCVDWHVDGASADAVNTRKLSLSIQLSSADSYRGGDIEFAAQAHDPFSRELGSAVCFPSYCAHRVTTVTEGERTSLVAFAIGSAFR